jgi:hypothetical protein
LQARRIHNPLAAFLCLKERDVAGEINLVSRFATSSESIGTAMREPVPAAQYVRMSTEHQRYSTENQSDAILQYAVRYGFDIVRTYADNGKSGLRLDGRDALKQLLIDVQGGSPGFKAVLVYDVSRWGPLPGRRRERLLRICLPALGGRDPLLRRAIRERRQRRLDDRQDGEAGHGR